LDFLGGPSNLQIIRCRLDPQCTHGDSTNVLLKEIDIGEDLVEFLTHCLAEKLVIDSCPGLDDNAMMRISQVEDLSIRNCEGFSISTLKQLVETRRINWSDSKAMQPPPPIKVLQLFRWVPYVSPEDREWFKGHLTHFSYNPN
jgi:hypothetical protein